MAKCEKRKIKVEPPPVEIVLSMDISEACVLLAALDARDHHVSRAIATTIRGAIHE